MDIYLLALQLTVYLPELTAAHCGSPASTTSGAVRK